MSEYLLTDLPRYVKTAPRENFANSVVKEGAVLLFSEDGETLVAKHPDGTFSEIGSGSSGGDTSAFESDAMAIIGTPTGGGSGGESGSGEEAVTLSGTLFYEVTGTAGIEITPITFDMVASDGSPVTYAISSGYTLPAGLTLNGNTVSGTPTEAANESVCVLATAGDVTRTITLSLAITKPLELYRLEGTSTFKLADIASAENFKVDDQANAYIIDGKLYVKGALRQGDGWTDISCNNNLKSTDSFNYMGIRNGNLYIMSDSAYYGADNDWSKVYGAPYDIGWGYAAKSNGNLYRVLSNSSVTQVSGISGVTSVVGFAGYGFLDTTTSANCYGAMAIASGKLYCLCVVDGVDKSVQVGDLAQYTKVGSGIGGSISGGTRTLAICGGKLYSIEGYIISNGPSLVATQIGTMTDWSDVARNYAIRNGELYYYSDGTLSRVGTDSGWTAIAGGEMINQTQTANVYGICDGKLYRISSTTATQIGTDTDWESLSGLAFVTAIRDSNGQSA